MSLILCIETGTDICSVGIARDGELMSLRESDQGRDHAKQVAVFVDELLRETGVKPDELDAVAVGMGPGSYTGLRIGVSFAKGLCYGLNIPLLAVGSLEALTDVLSRTTRRELSRLRVGMRLSSAQWSMHDVWRYIPRFSIHDVKRSRRSVPRLSPRIVSRSGEQRASL